ncbi:MAG TPA: MBL fold metallo-hydrolase [Longimicrobiaceae bacterium]|nr:MBL fold metallo-hydrolase [Longimicrobiaceae bacterium]
MELDLLEALPRPQDPATAPRGAAKPVADDLACLRTGIVNVFLYGQPGAGDRGWVLVDAGLPGSAGRIARAAAERFGAGARPAAIVLTHGHFDHVGALRELAEAWDTPVFAHPLELPYLTGRSAYPPPDPTVGGGAMALLSWAYPRRPVDLGKRVRPLPADGSVPGMPEWRWIASPGHTPGHVSLFRGADRTLLAGDAVITVKQESAFAVLTQRPAVHGPPAYFTMDWDASRRSVRELASLEPWTLATGHGVPMRGPAMLEALRFLARNFDGIAVPHHGRYVGQPALADERGVQYVPPPPPDARNALLLALGGAFVAGLAAAALTARRRRGE